MYGKFFLRLLLVCAISLAFSVCARASGSPRFSIKTERPAYDANTDYVEVEIANHTDQEIGFVIDFQLEKLDRGQWREVPLMYGKEMSLATTRLSAGKTASYRTSMDSYEKPMDAGQYRLVKVFDEEPVSAEFEILPPSKCLRLPQPQSVTVTLDGSGGRGLFTVEAQESPRYMQSLWHELLTFQKGAKPEIKEEAFASMKLEGKSKASLEFYHADGKIWAKMIRKWHFTKWYFTDDTGFADRLASAAEEQGAFLPATADSLVEVLNALPPLKNVHFTAHDFTEPFQLSGWRSDRKTSGVTLSVFQFPSAEAVNRQMNYLYEDGYTLGIESKVGSGSSQAVSFGRQRFDWSDPPHYFKAGSRLVLYNGSDSAILSTLTGLLGSEVEAQG